jgi:SAM-dependent methyltransferase
MESIFKTRRQSNQWDNMAVDVRDIYKKHPIEKRPSYVAGGNSTAAFFSALYRTPLLPLSIRRFLRKIARQTNLDLGWFYDFSAYWSDILGGRPLWGVQDFYYLTNLYRVKFQDNQIPETNDADVHLEAWQKPELLYQLLHLVYKETVVDYAPLIRQMFRHKRNIRSFIEFGCGTAPVTASFFEFFKTRRDVKAFYADIQTIAFHYAAHRLGRYPSAEPLLLLPENAFRLPASTAVDAVICITVFEHLNKPLETARDFYNRLSPGGLLVFDYIKNDGEGMDTAQGANERDDVLDFIAMNFEILVGELSKENSTGLIIARKV